MHRSIRVHTTVLMRSRLSTLERSKADGIARCDVKMLAHATNTKKRLEIIYSLQTV